MRGGHSLQGAQGSDARDIRSGDRRWRCIHPLENRGGARANVDEVKILAVTAVKGSTDDGFVADVRWTVSGSVSHFGHTHYRRNQYHAMVTFTAVNGFWKIRDIELVDEKRLL